MSTWYEKLKFDINPLDARPNPNLVGLDNEAIKQKHKWIEGKTIKFWKNFRK